MSGWDIINVAQALAIPRSWSERLSRSPLGSLHADSSVLFEYTTRFDQILGSVFYWILMISGGAAPLIIGLNSMGVID